MALPKAAQKQIADAEKLHAEVYSPEPDHKEASNEESRKGESTDAKTGAQVSTEETHLREVQEDAGENKENDPAHWKHKYDVLKGKYDAEVPRLQQSNNTLQGQMSELQQQMQELALRGAEPKEVAEAGHYLKDDEIEDYGEDMINVIKRAAREEFEPVVVSLQQENEQLKSLLGGMHQQTVNDARQDMLDQLDTQLSTWRETNQSPEFLGWLENVDAFSGQKRLDMLRQAFEGNNTARVMAFFKGFLNENAAFTPGQSPDSTAQPQVNLETLVAPGKASEGDVPRAQGSETGGRFWSQRDISEFYGAVNRGSYRDNPAEKEKLERDIFLAQSEGRITP